MKIQLLSDLHLETESFEPRPAPGAELLLLAGDIDSRWDSLALFRDWPVPVVMVAGNHEFDHRDLSEAWPALRAHCSALGIRLMERETAVFTGADGRRIRFVCTIRWCDFDLFGPAGRSKAMRAAEYYLRYMGSTQDGLPLDAEAMRSESLACRDWLASSLAHAQAKGPDGRPAEWDATLAVTHFGPSLRSADPRYGAQPGTASFCNADDTLIPLAEVWVHGHLHCRHDYSVPRPGGGSTRVLCQARGHSRNGEADGHRPQFVFEV